MLPGDSASQPNRRRLWQVIAVVAVLVVVLAVFASQRGGDSDGGGGPLNAIAQAAATTQGEGGGRSTMRMVVKSPSQPEPLHISGQMSFDAGDRTSAVLEFSDPETGQSAEIEMVTDGATVYMHSSLFGSLPDGSEWMSLDLASATGLDEDALVPSEADAKGELELLEETSNVRKLGKGEAVNGVPTTHFGGTVSAAENADRLREKGGDEDFASLIEEEGAAIRVEAWIDADELVRRMRIVQTQPGDDGEGPTTTDMRMDFFDFGIDPDIEVPDSDEVFDATSVTEEELGLPK